MTENIKKQLKELSEPEFQKFASKLIPNIDSNNVLGVRLPALRKIAKKIAKGNWRDYLNNATEDSFEETMLQGMVIGYINDGIDVVMPLIEEFVTKIDNWSVCDSFCSGLKIAKMYPKEMWEYIQICLNDSRAYVVRFGIVMIINYYTNDEYIDKAVKMLYGIRQDDYYVQMAVAWAISMYYVKNPIKTMEYLRWDNWEVWTYNKALQKIIESKQVSNEEKVIIRGMKR